MAADSVGSVVAPAVHVVVPAGELQEVAHARVGRWRSSRAAVAARRAPLAAAFRAAPAVVAPLARERVLHVAESGIGRRRRVGEA